MVNIGEFDNIEVIEKESKKLRKINQRNRINQQHHSIIGTKYGKGGGRKSKRPSQNYS